jgi:hypothetical protein
MVHNGCGVNNTIARFRVPSDKTSKRKCLLWFVGCIKALAFKKSQCLLHKVINYFATGDNVLTCMMYVSFFLNFTVFVFYFLEMQARERYQVQLFLDQMH